MRKCVESGAIIDYSYDVQGDMIGETGPAGYDVSYSYVKNSRHIHQSDEDGEGE